MFTGVPGNLTYQFDSVYGMDYDSNTGTFYVADRYGYRIFQFQQNNLWGNIVAGGNGNGLNTNQLREPYAVYYDSLTNSLLIANAASHNIVRWVIGEKNWTLIMGTLTGSSGNSATRFWSPSDVMLDPMGNMYVVDRFNYRLQFFQVDKSNGTTIAGITGVRGINASLFYEPISMTLDSQLNLYVVDAGNHRIQKFMRY